MEQAAATPTWELKIRSNMSAMEDTPGELGESKPHARLPRPGFQCREEKPPHLTVKISVAFVSLDEKKGGWKPRNSF